MSNGRILTLCLLPLLLVADGATLSVQLVVGPTAGPRTQGPHSVSRVASAIPARAIPTMVSRPAPPSVELAGAVVPAPPVDVSISIDPANRVGVSALTVGVTHTHHSLDAWEDPGSVGRGRTILRSMGGLQGQAIMGWGALNPEPAAGLFDFSSLDQRMALIRATGGVPVITLCCAPDWMKGGRAGTTDWNAIEVAPTADHYGDFAKLARQVALRYPDVRNYVVWNELKGFWNSTLNRWDYEGYTALYNAVYAALKGVDPTLNVGGPYIPILSGSTPADTNHPSALRGSWGIVDQRGLDVLIYWRQHALGADFVAVDDQATTTRGLLWPDEYGATSKLEAITRWARDNIGLPVWWPEWYVLPAGTDGAWGLQRSASVLADAMIHLVSGGATAALGWKPEGDATCGACLWTRADVPGGAQATPWQRAMNLIMRTFPAGTPLIFSAASNPKADVLASPSTVLIINRTPGPLVVGVGKSRLVVPAYGVATQAIR